MATQRIDIEQFLDLAKIHPVIDVRSPGEFIHAHIPSAFSLPLFSDEERKVIGTLYKQESRQKAIKKGLEYFGVKMLGMVETVEKLLKDKEAIIPVDRKKTEEETEVSKTVLVHCWRGGMRSSSVAWLLDLYGFKVYTLVGGYKAFRQWVLAQFEKEYDIKIIGGYTGSGKTLVLHEMQKRNASVIDLEGLACHKGSAFGAINMPVQPSQEMFENNLALSLYLTSINNTSPIYIEDESQRIGSVNLPIPFWKLMRTKPVLFLDIPFEERLKHIVKDYGKGDKEKLVNAIIRIKKRLGGLETKTAVNFLLEDDLVESFRVLLHYYDKQYKKGLENREDWQGLVTMFPFDTVDPAVVAEEILIKEKELTNV